MEFELQADCKVNSFINESKDRRNFVIDKKVDGLSVHAYYCQRK